MKEQETMIPWGSAKLSVVRALLGEVTPCILAVSVDNRSGSLTVWVYTDRPMSPNEQEDFDACVMTQVVSDFPDEVSSGKVKTGCRFMTVQMPSKVNAEGQLVFMRKDEAVQQGGGTLRR
jgi:hypothetical protein